MHEQESFIIVNNFILINPSDKYVPQLSMVAFSGAVRVPKFWIAIIVYGIHTIIRNVPCSQVCFVIFRRNCQLRLLAWYNQKKQILFTLL